MPPSSTGAITTTEQSFIVAQRQHLVQRSAQRRASSGPQSSAARPRIGPAAHHEAARRLWDLRRVTFDTHAPRAVLVSRDGQHAVCRRTDNAPGGRRELRATRSRARRGERRAARCTPLVKTIAASIAGSRHVPRHARKHRRVRGLERSGRADALRVRPCRRDPRVVPRSGGHAGELRVRGR